MRQISQSGVGGAAGETGVAHSIFSRDLHYGPRHQQVDPGQPEGDARCPVLGGEQNVERVWQEVSGRTDRHYRRATYLGPDDEPPRAYPLYCDRGSVSKRWKKVQKEFAHIPVRCRKTVSPFSRPLLSKNQTTEKTGSVEVGWGRGRGGCGADGGRDAGQKVGSLYQGF